MSKDLTIQEKVDKFIKDLKLSFQIYFIQTNNYAKFINSFKNNLNTIIKEFIEEKLDKLQIKMNLDEIISFLLK